MRIRDFTQLEVFENSGLAVLTGKRYLNREISWVHSGEIADIAQYLSGGEALLTAATGVGAKAASHRRYVRELSEANVACVVIELGRGFHKVPETLIGEAERLGVVLISLEKELRFAEVTRSAHEALIESSHVALEQAIEIDDALNSLILEGGSLATILELLASRLHNPVILEDGARRVVEYGRSGESLTQFLQKWHTHSRQGHQRGLDRTVEEVEEPKRCLWTTITVRGDEWGRLHVIEFDSPLGGAARLALGRAAGSIALYLMGERDAALSDAAEDSLVGALAFPGGFSGQEFLARAGGLGVDLESDLIVVVVAGSKGVRSHLAISDGVHELRRILKAKRWAAVVGSVGGELTAIMRARDRQDLIDPLNGILDRLDPGGSQAFQIGVSRKCGITQLPQAQKEARAANRSGPSTSNDRVYFYDDLALLRLLSPLDAGPTLANFVERELNPLFEYDKRRNSELIGTLSAFLAVNGSKIQAARMLQVERRTVYYRLERIEELLGISLEDPEIRIRLYLALRALEVMNLARED
jgi:purine catabolism regulator